MAVEVLIKAGHQVLVQTKGDVLRLLILLHIVTLLILLMVLSIIVLPICQV